MSAGIVAREHLVVGGDGAQIEIHLRAEGERDFEQVAVKLFHQLLVARRQDVERARAAGEVGADEGLEGGGAAVLGGPELGHLIETALDARPQGFAVGGHQLPFEFDRGILHKCGAIEGRQRNSHERE